MFFVRSFSVTQLPYFVFLIFTFEDLRACPILLLLYSEKLGLKWIGRETEQSLFTAVLLGVREMTLERHREKEESAHLGHVIF
jgi:hypothetical protein